MLFLQHQTELHNHFHGSEERIPAFFCLYYVTTQIEYMREVFCLLEIFCQISKIQNLKVFSLLSHVYSTTKKNMNQILLLPLSCVIRVSLLVSQLVVLLLLFFLFHFIFLYNVREIEKINLVKNQNAMNAIKFLILFLLGFNLNTRNERSNNNNNNNTLKCLF